jgi:hypothetical protein
LGSFVVDDNLVVNAMIVWGDFYPDSSRWSCLQTSWDVGDKGIDNP